MGKMRLLQIECDPYEKIVTYRTMNNGSWEKVTGRTALKSQKFSTGNLQQVIGNDGFFDAVFKAMPSSELMIEFIGTREDYKDLESAAMFYNQSNAAKNQVSCRMSVQRMYTSPSTILKRTEEIYTPLREEMQNSDESELQGALKGYDEASAKKIPLLMIGRYSSGKSTFVNALIGREILPMADGPETAMVYNIDNGTAWSISFSVGKTKIAYELGKTNGLCPPGTPVRLRESLQALTSTKDASEYEIALSDFLRGLNAFCRDEHSAGIVSITLPWNSQLQGDRFQIIDLPGVDSDSFHDHRDLVEKVLKRQSHGLPIFLTTSESIDSEKDTYDQIKKLSDKMDWANMLIVVNKADRSDTEELNKALTGPACIKSLGNRILVVSSILALGSKRQGVFHSKHISRVYGDSKIHFSNPQDDNYFRLYELNHIPQAHIQADQIIARKIEQTVPIDEMEIIAWNSGIRSIERELNDYGNLLVDYLKSKEASASLARAIEILKEVLEQKLEREKEEESALKDKFEERHKQLCNDLKSEKTTIESKANQDCTKSLQILLVQWKEEKLSKLLAEMKEAESRGEGIRNLIERNKYMRVCIADLFISYLQDLLNKMTAQADEIWQGFQEKYEAKSLEMIQKEDSLSEEEKAVFKDAIQKIDPPKPPELNTRSMITWFRSRIKKRVTLEELGSKLETGLSENGTIIEIREGYKASFNDWYETIRMGLAQKAKEWNPELQELEGRRQHAENERKRYEGLMDKAYAGAEELSTMIKAKVVGLT